MYPLYFLADGFNECSVFSASHSASTKVAIRCQRVKMACRQGCAGNSLTEQMIFPPYLYGHMIPLINISVSIFNAVLEGFTSFPKSRNHLKILGARMVTYSTFHA